MHICDILASKLLLLQPLDATHNITSRSWSPPLVVPAACNTWCARAESHHLPAVEEQRLQACSGNMERVLLSLGAGGVGTPLLKRAQRSPHHPCRRFSACSPDRCAAGLLGVQRLALQHGARMRQQKYVTSTRVLASKQNIHSKTVDAPSCVDAAAKRVMGTAACPAPRHTQVSQNWRYTWQLQNRKSCGIMLTVIYNAE